MRVLCVQEVRSKNNRKPLDGNEPKLTEGEVYIVTGTIIGDNCNKGYIGKTYYFLQGFPSEKYCFISDLFIPLSDDGEVEKELEIERLQHSIAQLLQSQNL